MQTKLLAAAAVLAVTCFVGGAVLSDRLDGAERGDDVAALRSQWESDRARLESLEAELEGARSRSAGKIARLDGELDLLRERLLEKDRAIAGLEEQVRSLTSPEAAGDAEERSREERWADIRQALAGVMAILEKMSVEGANQFELGPRMVAELGKLSPEQFEEMAAFDATETDPEIVDTIRAVMLQALIFVPETARLRDDYMERYLQRAVSGNYGENFTAGALSRISFAMPPFVDAYAKIVEPLDDEVKGRFLDLALERVEAGHSPALRMDGVRFLARSSDPRAVAESMRIVGQAANPPVMRLTALRGLAGRADEEVLRFLRDTRSGEADQAFAAELDKAVAKVERLVAQASSKK